MVEFGCDLEAKGQRGQGGGEEDPSSVSRGPKPVSSLCPRLASSPQGSKVAQTPGIGGAARRPCLPQP